MKIKNYIYSLLTAFLMLFMAGCSPDEYSLGDSNITSDDLVEGLAYTITHDSDNPNIVYLKSLLPSRYTVLWDSPAGRSQSGTVTLKLPFAGSYQVRMGVETRGGIVYGPETTFTVKDFCSDFVSGELWEQLTGGVGKSKKWYLDIDEKSICRYFVGPLYFYGTADNWNTVMLSQAAPAGADSWSWAADWAGNGSWLFNPTGAMDYGYMEFGLDGGATVKVVDKAANKTYNGTFLMDTDNHTMKLTDAPVLHDPGRDAIVTQWENVTILALDENHMQLAVLRDNSSEGKCLLSYNFISEDYKNNWTPTVTDNSDVVPALATDWRDYVEPKTQKQTTFKLSEENPYGYANADGSTKTATLPTALSGIEDLTLTFNRNDNSYQVTTPVGDSYTGSYTLSDDGIYTFSNALPVVQLSTNGEVNFRSNAENLLRITSYTTDDYSGALKDLYLGYPVVDDQGKLVHYLTYHFVLQTAGSSVKRYTGVMKWFDNDYNSHSSDNVYITTDGNYTFTINGSGAGLKGLYIDIAKLYKDYNNCDVIIKSILVDGVSVSFDDTLIDRGTADGDLSTARRYIVNPWGATQGDAAKYVFSNSLSVTVQVVLDSGSNVMNP